MRKRYFIVLFLILFSFSSFAEEQRTTTGPDEKNVTKLDEIIVTASPFANPVMPVNTHSGSQYNLVTEDQIKEQNVHDFQSALRDVPGVMYQSKNIIGSQTSHSLYIRGRGASHPGSDVVVEFDGVPRYGALFGQVLGDSIAVPTIGEITIFKNPMLSEFGSGYAAVNILPKYMKQEGSELVHTFSGGSFFTFNESISGGYKKGLYDAYVSQSWISTDGDADHSRAQQQNYYANAGYQINSRWNVRFLANYVDSQTVAPMPDRAPSATNAVSWPTAERFDTETFLSTLTLSNQYDRVSGYLKAYYNDTTFDLLQELNNGKRYAEGTDGLWSRQEIGLYGIRAKEKLHLWPGGGIVVGADFDKTELKNTQRTYSGAAVPNINGGLAKRVWDFPDTTLISPYLAFYQIFGKTDGFHITPSAGVRYYDHSEFESKTAAEGGLVAGYNRTDINFNYARGVNYPSPVVLMNAVLTADPKTITADIKPEVVDHYELGLSHTWPAAAALKATAFLDKGKDRVQAYMFGPVPTQYNDSIGKYEIKGLELAASVTPLKNLECFAAATWLEAEATGSNGVKRDHMPYTPSFQLQAGAKWSFLDHFRFVVDLQHMENVYAGTVSRAGAGSFNYAEFKDKDKLGDITLCNARLSYSFDHKKLHLSDSEIFLALNNIFNEDYEYAKGYPMPGTTVFAGYSLKFR
jgi:iron complex outermembrane receptor protein